MSFLKNLFAPKEDKIQTYADFWTWFQQQEKTFFKVVQQHNNIEKDFLDKISPKLNQLREGFFFLTGMYSDDTAELILTADGAIRNLVFVEELVAAAPQIAGWRFTALKPPAGKEAYKIRMDGYAFTTENLSFYANEFPEYPDEIDITVVHDDLNADNEKTLTTGTYIFLDNYLGELNFAASIDRLTVIGKQAAEKELIPIGKLAAFLVWREKEFVEKYDGTRHDSENESYSLLEAQLDNGNMLLAVINKELLNWEAKASHPWILSVEIPYKGTNGMPDKETYTLLDQLEDDLLEMLPHAEGYLNIGRETANDMREIYFACREFRRPAKVMAELQRKYTNMPGLSFDIYKDKYWQSFNRFR
jgi:hypothetical protein